MKVLPEFCNPHGSLHGGAVCTIIDLATSMVASLTNQSKPFHVTLNLSTNMMKGVAANEEIFIISRVDKFGKNVVFMDCDIYSSKGEICYSGSHVKSFLKKVNMEKMSPKI